MSKSIIQLLGCILVGLIGVRAEGAEVKLKPISADGSFSIVGNEIILEGGGQRVFIEGRLSGWAPDQLQAYQIKIDSTGYTSGIFGRLTPATEGCVTDADCEAVFSAGSECKVPPINSDRCAPGYIDDTRTDFVFTGLGFLAASDISSLNYRFSGLAFSGLATDPGSETYGGTLVLDVPIGAHGTFTIRMVQAETTLQDGDTNFITPITFTPAVVTVKCISNIECTDGNACTTDTCNLASGTCSNTDTTPSTLCCNPVNGALTAISDDNDCTDDVCVPATGQVTHVPHPIGTACGDPSDTECDNPDTCDGIGTCRDNLEANGFACGSPSDTECTDPDTCDGSGACQDNHEALGTDCGDPSDDQCDHPDTCDGGGGCLVNQEPNGTTCDDGLFCNILETCTGGACGGGGARNCSDGVSCTTDTCDDIANTCVNTLDAGSCRIAGVCRSEGQLNPANDCESCDTGVSTTDWTSLNSGVACGDSLDTDCTNPDTCDGAGACQDNHEASGTTCGDVSDTDCTNPDTCNATGVCLDNHESDGTICTDDGNDCTNDLCEAGDCDHPNKPSGVACGDLSDTDCDNPDTCNGTGTCLINNESDGPAGFGLCDDLNDCTQDNCLSGICDNPNESVGTPCGDPADTDCDNPDTCDGAGFCEDNLEPGGFVCTDDGNDCTSDTCDGAGTCDHPNLLAGDPCGDPSDTDCTNPDTCDGAGACLDNHELVAFPCGDPSDTICTNPDTCDGGGNCLDNHELDGTSCDDTLFCNGEDLCDIGACAHSGSPCGGPCDEDNDTCLCEAPLVEVVGSRYLKITPQPPGSGPQAILIAPDCGGSTPLYANPPVPFDIDGDGSDDENIAQIVSPDAVAAGFLTPAEWGELYVYGVDLVPGTTYIVHGDCGSPGTPGLSDPTSATTCVFGDVARSFDNGIGEWVLCSVPPPLTTPVNIVDVIGVIERFVDSATAPSFAQADVVGTGAMAIECLPDQKAGIIPDAIVVLGAFQGRTYESFTGCPTPCP